MAHNWIGQAIKHPGVEKAKAKRSGRTTHQQLEIDAKSRNSKTAHRGRLGLTLEKMHGGKR